jgi:hypothetical protein
VLLTVHRSPPPPASAFGLAVDDDHDGKPDRYILAQRIKPAVPATVGVDGPDPDAKPDTVLTARPRSARGRTARPAQTPAQWDLEWRPARRRHHACRTARRARWPRPNWPGLQRRGSCPRTGATAPPTVKAIALHYTAGANRPGLSDMNGLTAFASSPSAGVSWTFLIDGEGHCYYSVPLAKKSWTIGNLNSQTVNIEVIGTGGESTYPASPAGLAKLRAVVRRIAGIYKIPLQLGATDGQCHVTKPGILTHWMGGVCSGGHIDIKPFSIEATVRAIAADPPAPAKLTAAEQRRVDQLQLERKVASRHGGWAKVAPSHLANASAAKAWLRRRVAAIQADPTPGRLARARLLREVIG